MTIDECDSFPYRVVKPERDVGECSSHLQEINPPAKAVTVRGRTTRIEICADSRLTGADTRLGWGVLLSRKDNGYQILMFWSKITAISFRQATFKMLQLIDREIILPFFNFHCVPDTIQGEPYTLPI